MTFQELKEKDPNVYRLAKLRQREQEYLYDGKINLMANDAFAWSETPEKHDFWSEINDGKFEVYYFFYPNCHDGIDERVQIKPDKLKTKMNTADLPAFYKSAFYHPDGGIDPPQDGLTKREYFAAMAMQGIVSNEKFMGKNAEIAKVSISLADELINQLQK